MNVEKYHEVKWPISKPNIGQNMLNYEVHLKSFDNRMHQTNPEKKR